MSRGVPLRRRLGLTRSLTLAVAVVLSVLLVTALAGAFALVQRESYRALDVTLVRSANALIRDDQRGEAIPSTTDCQWLGAPACSQTTAPDGTGTGVFPVPADAAEIASGEHAPQFHTATLGDEDYRLYTAPLADGAGTVTVGYRSDSVQESLDRTRWLFIALAALSLAVSAGAGALISRALLRDLRTVTATAEAVAGSQDLSLRVTMPGHDDLAQLAQSFNTMVESLQASRSAQQQLVADASHELRTPLTAIRANAALVTNEALGDAQRTRARANLHSAIADMSDLVTDVLDLARGSEPDPFAEPLRLDDLLDSAVASVQQAWPGRRFEVKAAPAVVVGSEQGLYRVLTNLLSNAAKYSDGPVEAVLWAHDGHAYATIRDHGPGVPSEHRERIFDRFYRAPSSAGQPGSGLGLAVAQQIALAHGGRILPDWPAGGGTLMTLVLPLAESNPPSR